MKNTKITKIVYTIIGLITSVFVFGQPAFDEEDVVDNAPVSSVDDYIIIGVIIAIFFSTYTLQKKYSSRVWSIKKQ